MKVFYKLSVQIFIILLLTVILAVWVVGGIYLSQAFSLKYRKDIEPFYSDWRLVSAIIKTESGFNEFAKSSAGACGLMQLLPSTAEFIAQKYNVQRYDLFIAEDNIRLGCFYLKYLENRFTDTATVLSAYNAGEGVVREWLQNENYSTDGVRLQVIPYTETKKYVEKIKKYYAIYQKIYLTNENK